MGVKKKIAADLPAQKWYRKLEPKYKALYIHLLCIANVGGVFEVDEESLRFHVKDNTITAHDLFSRFGNRIQKVPNHPDKAVIVGYVDFQHSFSRHSNQWRWVQTELEKVGLTEEILAKMAEKVDAQMELALEITEKPPKTPHKSEKNIIPPTVEMVEGYCRARKNRVVAQAFCDFYESKGWKVGNVRMKDWQAAVRTWEKRGGNEAAADGSIVKKSVSVASALDAERSF